MISADSMQVYKGMDIATAKPSKEEMQGVPHHMLDIIDPGESFSVARFKELAQNAADDIIARGKVPVVAGGTGLYIDALVQNTVFVDGGESGVREKLLMRAEEIGTKALYDELKGLDPQTAEKLHINDKKRILRALELYYSTGVTMTEQRELSHLQESKYDFCIFALSAHDRQILYDRINARVDMMLESGLLEEAKAFFKNSSGSTAKQAIGYKELLPHLEGQVSLKQAAEKLKTETRRYAKRQLSWFRRNENIHWLYIDEKDAPPLAERCVSVIKQIEGEEDA